jgi:hypothetical protein
MPSCSAPSCLQPLGRVLLNSSPSQTTSQQYTSYIYTSFPTLANIVNQAYNYDIYKNEFNTSPLLNAFIGTFATYLNENQVPFIDIIYRNPNIINFFYYNPRLMTFFLENCTYFQNFVNITEIADPMTDIYQLIYNIGSPLSDYLNPCPPPVSEFSCIGLDYNLDSLISQNSILQSLLQQNYNNNIYYLSLYNNDNLVQLLSNTTYFDQLSPIIQSNPNLLNFMSQNDRLVLALLANPALIADMIAIPHIADPAYDLNILFYQSPEFTSYIDYPPSFDPLSLCTVFVTPTECGNANVIIDVLAGNLSANLDLLSVPFGNLNITGNLIGNVAANITEFSNISVTNDNFTNSSTPTAATNPLFALQNIQFQINQAVYENLYSRNVYNSRVDGVCSTSGGNSSGNLTPSGCSLAPSGQNSSIQIRTTAPFNQFVSGIGKIYIRTLNLMIPDLFRLPWSDPTQNASVSKDNPFSEGTNTVCPYLYYKNSKPSGFQNGVYNKQCLLDDSLIKSLLYFGFSGMMSYILAKNNPFNVTVTYANPTYPATNTTIQIQGQSSPFHLINFMTNNIRELNIPIQPNQNAYKFDSFVSYFYKRFSPYTLLYQLVLLLQQMDISYRNKSAGKTNCDHTIPWDFTIAGYYDTEEIISDYPIPRLKQSEMVDIYLLYQRIRGLQTLNYRLNLNSAQLFYSAYTQDSYLDFLRILTLTREVLRDVYLEYTYRAQSKTRYIQKYMYPQEFEVCKATFNRYIKNKMNLAIKH